MILIRFLLEKKKVRKKKVKNKSMKDKFFFINKKLWIYI